MRRLEQNGQSAAFHYREHPLPGVGPWFACAWTAVIADDPVLAARARILPDNRSDFIVGPGGAAWYVGPATVAELPALPPGAVLHGLRLHPAAMQAITGVTGDALTDRQTALDDLLSSRRARLLPEALAGERLTAALLRDLWPSQPVSQLERAISLLEHAPGSGVQEIAAAMGWSPRHFRRQVLAETGLSPKLLQRVGRLHRFLALARAEPAAPLARFAFAAGYADQAHLARELTALTGVNPTGLLREPGLPGVFAPRETEPLVRG